MGRAEDVKWVLDNDDFIYFLYNTIAFSNGPTRFDCYLSKLLEAVTVSPPHLRTSYWKNIPDMSPSIITNFFLFFLLPLFLPIKTSHLSKSWK